MLNKKKKVSFDKVWEVIQQTDIAVGLFLFKDTSIKLSRKEKFLAKVVPANATIITILVVSTLIITNFKLINVIFCVSHLTPFVSVYIIILKLKWNKNTLKDLVKWCENLYDVDKKYHELIREIAEKHVVLMERRTLKMLKWLKTTLYVEAFGVILGYALVGQLLPEKIYPKYSLPLPYYLPFKDQETYTAFITTLVVQLVLSILSVPIGTYVFGVFYTLVIHILGTLDIIQEFVEKKKVDMVLSLKPSEEEQKHQQPTTSKSTLQLEVLAQISQTLPNPNEISFNEWIKIVTEMISDVSATVSSFSKLYTEFFLTIEIATLGSLFVAGLIFTVVREQYFFAVGISLISVFLHTFCYINEKILEKFENIKEALYDLPWYTLELKEMRELLIAMNCDQIQKGFTAGGTHPLTIERFAIIMKAGYTNLLVLKDLVQK